MSIVPPIPANPPISPPASLTEFVFVPQGSLNPIGIRVNVLGIPTNVDLGTDVVVSVYVVPYPATTAEANGVMADPVYTGLATSPQTGVYQMIPASSQTLVPGYYRFDWSFTLNGNPVTTSMYVQVGPPSPAYDALQPPFVNAVEQVWIKFADMYDSAYGGPYLTIWYNQHFGRGRVAQLMEQAVWHINNEAQLSTVYSVTGVAPMGGGAPLFPLNQWAGLLNSATTVEVIKHLMRSYTEEPVVVGNVTLRMDRRDYQQRWQTMLDVEQPQYLKQLAVFKTEMMFNGSPRVLIQGGAFGNYGVPRMMGSLPARPYYMNRWFKYSQVRPVVSLDSCLQEIVLTRGCGSARPRRYEKYIW